jgi:hypothetical protein
VWERVTNIKRQPDPPKHYALLDTSVIRPPEGEKMFASHGATHGFMGKVLQTFESRSEAEKSRGTEKNRRVVRVTSNFKAGHWISPSDTVAEICRGLPPR